MSQGSDESEDLAEDFVSEDNLAAARKALGDIVRGRGGRNAATRLRAAEMLLGKKMLEQISDADLLAEVKRRNEAAKKNAP